ncbi:transcription termination factor Rho [Intrasporangium sp.]|uniref:transcription termination factor Rho n=1 Tax=Intrasporangium sp. TaxID=1925024 RepID=UPI003221A885
MSDTTTRPVAGLSTMKLDELKAVASSMGIRGTTRMRKSDLVAAILDRQSGGSSEAARAPRRTTRPAGAPPAGEPAPAAPAGAGTAPAATEPAPAAPAATAPAAPVATESAPATPEGTRARPDDRTETQPGHGTVASRPRTGERGQPTGPARHERTGRVGGEHERQPGHPERGDHVDTGRPEHLDDRGRARSTRTGPENRERHQAPAADREAGAERVEERDHDRGEPSAEEGRQERPDRQERADQGNRQGAARQQPLNREDEDRAARRGRNRNRNRDRKRRGQDWNEAEVQVGEDDVLVPVGGILDVLDNYAFVRTTGYLPGPNDVYVPLGMVKKHGLRKGDAITGAVKALRDGEQSSGHSGRQKYNALVRLDTVNGASPEDALKRVEFHKMVPLYPQQRLRLETVPQALTTRVIDLVAPIGKGQRGLIVAPAKAGKTMVMQAIANAITTNNPECHLMVVLVDERPEEVTEMQRAVKGEVISSTFDRPAEDHTTVAELSIERAKRLVELGHDVVVLLDSITKLGRAYNLSAPASGRILSGGVDSAALYPPKKFFGAARNIENGGSLTILATALVETGSKMDEVIFEEFKGTGNMELRLSRELANRRIFPAVDVNASGTRREEILLAAEELKIMWKLRRVLAALDPAQAIEVLLDRLKKTRTNYEFLMQVQQTSSIHPDDQH